MLATAAAPRCLHRGSKPIECRRPASWACRILLCAATVACGQTQDQPPGDPSVCPDSSDAGAPAGFPDPRPCAQRLAGHLGHFSVDLYLPNGRVPHAPVFLAREQKYARLGISVDATTLDERGAAAFDLSGNDTSGNYWLKAELRAGESCLRVQLTRNTADFGSDIMQTAESTDTLCPAGEPPAPVLFSKFGRVYEEVPVQAFGPRDFVRWAPTVPIAADGKPVLRVDGTEWPTTWHAGPRGVAAQLSLPPNRDVTFDFSAVRDVMGRVPLVDALVPLRTRAVLQDLAFTAAPAEGALATEPAGIASHRDGALSLSAQRGCYGAPSRYSAVLALGDAEGKSTFAATLHAACTATDPFRMELLAADGQATAVPVECTGDFRTYRIPLPGPGPFHLAVIHRPPEPEPQSLVVNQFCNVTIDALAFE